MLVKRSSLFRRYAYSIVDSKTREILDDAQRYGYNSEYKAYNAYENKLRYNARNNNS